MPKTARDHSDINGLDIVHQIFAGKWFVGLFVIFFGVIGLLFSQISPNQYSAASVVQIEKRTNNLALPSELLEDMLTGDLRNSTLETEFHVIKSSLVLGRVIDDLDLNLKVEPLEVPLVGQIINRLNALADGRWQEAIFKFIPLKYARPDEGVTIESFFATELDGEISLTVQSAKSFKLDMFNAAGEELASATGMVGERTILGNYLNIVVSEISAHDGAQFRIKIFPKRDVVAEMAKSLFISERGGRNGTGIVDFLYTAEGEKLAVSIINSVVEEYQSQSLSRRSAEIDQSIAFIEQQIPVASGKLAKALKELNLYRTSSGSYSDLSIVTQEVLARIVELEARLEEIKFEKSQLAIQVTQNHPDFLRANAEEAEVAERLEKMRAELIDVPETEQILAQLTKDVQSAQQIQDQLNASLDQLKIVRASTVGTIRVLERAEVAQLTGPRRLNTAIAFLLLGFILGTSALLFRNSTRVGIEDTRKIEDLGLPVFATIPLVEDLRASKSKDSAYALAKARPHEIAVESIRGLRTGLHFTLGLRGDKVIALTSSAPNEGKSFISLNLAIVSGESNVKVLLVDADMRRGELAKTFGISRKQPGLSTYLSQNIKLEDIIHKSEKFGIDFVPTGEYPPNPSELLSSTRFKTLVKELGGIYDLVIFDCPPVLAVTDPVIVGTEAGATFLVVSHLRTSENEIESSIKNLNAGGVNVSGAIVNSYDQKRSKYGQNAAKYGYYTGAYNYSYRKRD